MNKFRESLGLLQRMISISSISRDEAAVADMLTAQLSAWDLSPERYGNNIVCRQPDFDPEKPTILLNSHLDTVKPAAGYTRDPLTPVVENGRLYGLGSNDAGGPLVSLLAAYRALIHTNQSYNLIFAASAEEEVSGKNGMEMLIQEGILKDIDLAIVGEPTGMQPAVAEKGLMVLDCTAFGVSGHAARNEGVNAIYAAMKAIDWFRTYKFERVSPFLGPVKMSVTQIQAGTQHNVVPDTCRFVVDVRVNELYSNTELLAIIKEKAGVAVQERSTRLASSAIPTSHPVVQRAVSLGLTPFGSPTMSDQALMPFTSLKIGPGQSSRSHTADEYIEIDEIQNGIDTYVKLLDRLTL